MRVINIVPSLLPVTKKVHIQVFVLRKEDGESVLNSDGLVRLQNSLDFAIKTFKDKFDIVLKPYNNPLIQVLPKPAPSFALSTRCADGGASKDEWGEAGEYFANNLAGWNVIPLGFKFPISVFVVQSIAARGGCSLMERTDYITISIDGLKYANALTHELGHCCSLRHREDTNNLMYRIAGTANEVTGWQKFIVRTSRHCSF